MGEWFGLPEWVAITALVALSLCVYTAFGYGSIRKAHIRTAARRPNLTEAEFRAMMEKECAPDIAQFLWDQCLSYVEPRLTPHPDDHLFDDLKIDDDDVSMDWTREWSERRGFHESNFQDWPSDWAPTVRNFGRWLEMGPI
ncbi:MAG: hypothetical protein AAGA34_08115 [Pseudomonadota bacterium]